MTSPQFLAPLSDQTDTNFLINEYLIRNGYFERIENIKAENKQLRLANAKLERQVVALEKKIETLEDTTRDARIRSSSSDDRLREYSKNFEKQLAAAQIREAHLQQANFRLQADLERLSLKVTDNTGRQRKQKSIEPSITMSGRPPIPPPRQNISLPSTPRVTTPEIFTSEEPIFETSAVLSPDTIMKGLSMIAPDDGLGESFSE